MLLQPWTSPASWADHAAVFARDARSAEGARWRDEDSGYTLAVALPAWADPATVDARVEDGVLEVRVQKRAQARRRRIPIVVRDERGAIVPDASPHAGTEAPRPGLWARLSAWFRERSS